MYSTASSYSDLSLRVFPYTTPPKIISNTKEIIKVLKEIIDELLEFIIKKIPEMDGSARGYGEDGWESLVIQYFILHAFKYNPLEIKSYLPLPKEL
jgi:hypothetical protein